MNSGRFSGGRAAREPGHFFGMHAVFSMLANAHRREVCPIRKHIGLVVFAVMSLLPAAGPALAASAATCESYAKETAAKARGVRQFACGYDLKDARWSTEPKAHATWCKGASEEAVAKEVSYRRGEMNFCLQCRAYATTATEFATENAKLKCGFSGPRWNGNKQDHFSWCMVLRDNDSAKEADVAASSRSMMETMEMSTQSETHNRIMQIAACKSR